ncbi:MAG: hypothetical protein EHM27_04000 [Deltaproteobacteria bacterium]|nr:MAG: hypothetical protein EHM27_04000 [Deltaproteobacteria bacterium]
MGRLLISIITGFVLLLNGCAGTTLIKNLALPPVSIIEGNITQLDKSGFTLIDNSGSIYVKAELPDNKELNISVDDKIKVYGNLQGGRERIFDGYVIRKSTGEQIVINNPAPHFGFVIQSSFK